MAISVGAAARRLCESSDWTLSNLELQKLLYLGHMLHLGEKAGPLVMGRFEAWDYGPVQPGLYHEVKAFGRGPIRNFFHGAGAVPAGTEADVLDEVMKHLRNAPPGRLVAITHWEKGAWAKHYRPGSRGMVIPDEDIRREYMDRVNEYGR